MSHQPLLLVPPATTSVLPITEIAAAPLITANATAKPRTSFFIFNAPV
jgi:hypothetical protein